MEMIQDKFKRKIACSKRKRGIVKKAMELSILCNQNILMIIYDKDKNKAVNYFSENDVDLDKLQVLITNKQSKKFSNKDYFTKFAPKFYKD